MKRLLLLLLLIPTAAPAQATCLPHDQMAEHLGRNWREGRIGLGIGALNPAVIEVWANHETGTWTATVTQPDGLTCIVAWGVSWESLEDVPVGQPS